MQTVLLVVELYDAVGTSVVNELLDAHHGGVLKGNTQDEFAQMKKHLLVC